jgi:hypothetical protein
MPEYDEALVERLAKVLDEAKGIFYQPLPTSLDCYKSQIRAVLESLSESHLIVPKTTFDGEENMAITKSEHDRISHENDVLWAIFKTCPGCKRLVPGVMHGCDIQHHIDLSGDCNQREELPLNKIVDLIQRFLALMSYMIPSRLPDNYGILQGLQNEFSEVLWEVQK